LFGEARLQRLGDEPLLAIEELNHAEISQVSMGIYERALFNLELGICWLDAGKVEPAIVVLRDANSLFGEGGNQMEQVIARLWLETALSVQFPASAVANLKSVMPSLREQQKPTPLMLHAGRAGRWLRKRGSSQLFKDPIIKKFFNQAGQILESLSTLRRHPPKKSDDPKPQLEIISFGDVKVRQNQRDIEISVWQTREARDLFFFLLQSPPLTKEQIALRFWPDISPARLKMRFKINIYRIRQALGQDVIIFEGDRYRFNRAVRYSWDREKLDELLQSVRNVNGDEKIKLLHQTIELLRGPYLADLDADWVISDRLRYQDIHQDLLVELAGMYLQSGQARECLHTARLALHSDPLLEAAHRLMIQAYATLHDPAGMTLQYRQYQQVLMSELGLQPSSEMNALYAQLLDTI
jgi:two-component SAPR family response regulator